MTLNLVVLTTNYPLYVYLQRVVRVKKMNEGIEENSELTEEEIEALSQGYMSWEWGLCPICTNNSKTTLFQHPEIRTRSLSIPTP